MFGVQAEDEDDEVRCDRSNWYNHSTGARPPHSRDNTSPGLIAAVWQDSWDQAKLEISLPPHRATSCLLELPLAAGAMMAAVGVVFLMEVRRMWEVLCR